MTGINLHQATGKPYHEDRELLSNSLKLRQSGNFDTSVGNLTTPTRQSYRAASRSLWYAVDSSKNTTDRYSQP